MSEMNRSATFTVLRKCWPEAADRIREAEVAGEDPQLVGMELRRLEDQRIREDGVTRAHALDAAAWSVKQALLEEAAKHGPIQLRFTSFSAPEPLRYVPVLPPNAWRR